MATVRGEAVKRLEPLDIHGDVFRQARLLQRHLQTPSLVSEPVPMERGVLGGLEDLHLAVASRSVIGKGLANVIGMLAANPKIGAAPVSPSTRVHLGAVELDGCSWDDVGIDVLWPSAVIVVRAASVRHSRILVEQVGADAHVDPTPRAIAGSCPPHASERRSPASNADAANVARVDKNDW